MRVLNDAFNHSLKTEETAALLLAGGIVQHGYQCGMIWGATLAAGAQAYELFGPGLQAETQAMMASQRLVASFRALNNEINCMEITGLDNSSSAMQMATYFLIKGGTVRCFRKAVKYANEAFGEINAALSKEPFDVPATTGQLRDNSSKKDGPVRHANGYGGGACGGHRLEWRWVRGLGSCHMDHRNGQFEGKRET